MRDSHTTDLFPGVDKHTTKSYIRDATGAYQFTRNITNKELIEIAMRALLSNIQHDVLSNPSQTRDYLRL